MDIRKLAVRIAKIELILLLTLTVYSVFNYVFIFKMHAFMLPKATTDYWIPLVIGGFLCIILYRPFVKALRIHERAEIFLIILITLLLGLQFSVVQRNLKSHFLELERVFSFGYEDSIPERFQLESNQKFKGYGNYRIRTVSGDDGQDLKLVSYFVSPFLSENGAPSNVLFCKSYEMTIRNYASEEDDVLDQKIKSFFISRHKRFQLHSLGRYRYFYQLEYSQDHKYYDLALKDFTERQDLMFLFCEGSEEPFEDRFGTNFWPSAGVISIGFLMTVLAVWGGNRKKGAALLGEKNQFLSKFYSMLHAVRENKLIVSTILVVVNVAVFVILVMLGVDVIDPSTHDLSVYGGLSYKQVAQGEYWRLISSMFLHSGIRHLFENMVFLILLGCFIESRINRIVYSVIYGITGVLSGLVSIFFHPHVISVGASGAIFGLCGLGFAFLFSSRIPRGEKLAYGIFIGIGAVYSLIMGMYTNADNVAHLSGLLIGFLSGFVVLLCHGVKEEEASV